jgi:hypothetical protein
MRHKLSLSALFIHSSSFLTVILNYCPYHAEHCNNDLLRAGSSVERVALPTLPQGSRHNHFWRWARDTEYRRVP